MRSRLVMGSLCSIACLVTLWLGSPVASAAPPKFVQNVTCRATSRQVPGYLDEKFLVSDDGLKLSANGDSYTVDRNARSWNSNYGVVNGRNDESPIVEFQFSKRENIAAIVVWNAPAARGFASVTIQIQDSDGNWRFIPGQFRLEPGSAEGDFTSQKISLPQPVVTNKLRMWCHSTHRGPHGQQDVASLVRVRFLESDSGNTIVSGPSDPRDQNTNFPADCGLVNVCHAPYFAKGDGVTDDTAAIQKAMDDLQATRQYLYLPAGTYLVSDTLRYRPGYLYGDNNIRGDGPDKTVIRLKDGSFSSTDDARPVITFGFQGQPGGRVSADWFNNNIRDLTIDIGANNAGAIGLQFYSNNAGAARNLVIRSGDGAGQIGLDLGYQDQNGPLLVDKLAVTGFRVGVSAGASVNSQTLVNLSLKDQTEAALTNNGQCLTVERMKAEGEAARVVSKWGFLALVDCSLNLTRQALSEETGAAVESGEYLLAVNLKTNGFQSSIRSKYPEPSELTSGEVGEYFSGPIIADNASLPHAKASKLRTMIPRLETPVVVKPGLSKWANVRNLREIHEVDDTLAVQRAMDSGAEIIYFPSVGAITISQTITIPPQVKGIVGFQSQVISVNGSEPVFEVMPGSNEPLLIEDLTDIGTVKHKSDRPLLLCNIQGINALLEGSGDVFAENVVGDIEVAKGQRVFGRQINTERLGTKLINRGGQLMIVGLKTERGGTLIETTDGGVSEILGGLCYTTNNGQLAPMIVNRSSQVFVGIGEVCYTGDPFRQIVLEVKNGFERRWERDQTPRRFDFLQGSAVVYDGR